MDEQMISEADLLAYLDGVALPHVEQALESSPELRAQLETLREADLFFQHLFEPVREADSQDIVDVVTGQASPQQQQRVAAYLLAHPEARAAKQELQQAWKAIRASLEPAEGKLLPLFQAFRLGFAGLRGGMRVSASEGREQAFQVDDLDARVTVRIDPAGGERWQMTGRVSQQGEALAGIPVSLLQAAEAPHTTSDPTGFFTFKALVEGTYELRLHLDQGIIAIPDIVLIDE